MESRKYSVFSIQYSAMLSLLWFGSFAAGAELKVDLNPADRRGEALSPHWENWACKEGAVLSNRFGEVTVIFRASEGLIVPGLYKGALDYGAHMAADGITVRDGSKLLMTLKGLTPGKHRIVTYHNELGDKKPAPLRISVNEKVQVEALMPSKRATNDYEVA